MLFDNMDVAVLDLTHGGIPLARHIAQKAHSVTAIDVYGTVEPKLLSTLEKQGIKVARTGSAGCGLVVAPIHLDPALITDAGCSNIITHHRAVGELLHEYIKGCRVVEITGTRAKTSSAILLADMASRSLSVISHTSRGVEHWRSGFPRLLHHGLSITPGSILEAMEHARDIGPDLFIFEVSLGGTGAADVGIITTLENEYPIAGSSSNSTRAKHQMIEYAKAGSTLLINASAGDVDLPDGVGKVTFSDSPDEADVFMENSSTGYWSIRFQESAGSMVIRFRPDKGYDPSAYTTAMVCAAAAAAILGIEPGAIESTLRDFRGVSGRMRLGEWLGRTMIDNSNSGMNIRSANQALEYSKKLIAGKSGRLVMILGEEAKQVCEGLDPEEAGSFVKAHSNDIDQIILVGERMSGIQEHNVRHTGDLNSAIKMTEEMTSESDIIICCVKCFR